MMRLLVGTCKIYMTAFAAAIGPYFLLKLLDELIIDTARTINVLFLLTVTFLFLSSFMRSFRGCLM
ncbi:MAG: hypothetical protein UZ22_OP11002000163 [Microgenomates bacterium OLB23]|nr:MAG: hypothetical protein UZ22_OP11002000163 [Microgenomates bacterium OLB23]